MRTRDRQERKRAEIRRTILDAARHLFIEGGYANVPIRRVATAVEYSPAALYRYFKTKDAIFDALAEEGIRLLVSRESLSDGPAQATAIERIRHFFWQVYEFATIHPEYFYLIFLDRSAPRLAVSSNGIRVLQRMSEILADLLAQGVAEGTVPHGLDPEAVYHTMVSAIHGVAALFVCDRIAPGVDADALAHSVLDLAMGGLTSGAISRTRLGPYPRRRKTVKPVRRRRR